MAQKPRAAHLRAVPDDRRDRTREKKRRRMLDAAGGIIDREGLAGVTMQALADELDCAVGTIYLYFPSKAALVAALQGEAIDTLRASFDTARQAWEGVLADDAPDDALRALALLAAFGAHWTAASVVFADEFELQRALLAERVPPEAAAEAAATVALLGRLLDNPASLVRDAAAVGAIGDGPADERALRWISALNGVLLLDRLAPLDRHRFRGQHLARGLTHDLLVGWGASPDDVEWAETQVDRLAARGPLAPPPARPGVDR